MDIGHVSQAKSPISNGDETCVKMSIIAELRKVVAFTKYADERSGEKN